MATFAEHFAADRRLTILKLLEQAPGYTANEYLLQSALAEHGHSVSLDKLRTDLAWMDEQDVIAFNGPATLTPRGLDVANGRASVPGIKRPVPGL